ncbi:MAG: XTP/dITP diphosphatase [Aerococcus sp.]|nr:XTP/dITP diphosphatase [Aerococcus sp.]
MMRKVVIATKNPGKAKEFEEMFSTLGYTVETLLDHPEMSDIEETGTTFEENSAIKATQTAKALHTLAIADDSGLAVEALNGEPGVYSARYAGLDKDDQKNREKLLKAMEQVPDEARAAAFHCVLTISDENGQIIKQYHGIWDGMITRFEQGSNGFGYDPIFYVPSEQKTAAELTQTRKDQLSHRGQAVSQLVRDLERGALNL